jgi:GTP 3',8-cyclase
MVKDALGREVRDLRISVTDRCNFRCAYCMPFDRYEWIRKEEILTFEEITRLAALFLELGVEKIRLTGGEPLLRHDLEKLVAGLAPLPGLKDLCLTTNGSLLAGKAALLAAAGLKRLNVSLDTLDEDKFARLSGRNHLASIIAGLLAARDAGLHPVKINVVVQRGVNDDEIPALVDFASVNGFAVRFIEFMDAGNANDWKSEKIVPKQEILRSVAAHRPLRAEGAERGSAPAAEYLFEDGRDRIGIIASVTEPFCRSCNRARLTADGKLVTCLFSDQGHDLRGLLRSGAADADIKNVISSVWRVRSDRYSEQRLDALRSGGPGITRKKIEMISLGG